MCCPRQPGLLPVVGSSVPPAIGGGWPEPSLEHPVDRTGSRPELGMWPGHPHFLSGLPPALAFQSRKAAAPAEGPGFTVVEKRPVSGRKKKVLAHRGNLLFEAPGDKGTTQGGNSEDIKCGT